MTQTTTIWLEVLNSDDIFLVSMESELMLPWSYYPSGDGVLQ